MALPRLTGSARVLALAQLTASARLLLTALPGLTPLLRHRRLQLPLPLALFRRLVPSGTTLQPSDCWLLRSDDRRL
jgi:hypothetical protein